ncbi:MAG: hypothetical protein ACLR3C_12395 [Eggerthella lenta]
MERRGRRGILRRYRRAGGRAGRDRARGRADDERTGSRAQVRCAATDACVAAERHVMRALDGGCQVPIGAYARYEEGLLVLDAFVLARRLARAEKPSVRSVAAAQRHGRGRGGRPRSPRARAAGGGGV